MAKKRKHAKGLREKYEDFILDMQSMGYKEAGIKTYQQRVGRFVDWCESQSVISIDEGEIRRFRKTILDTGVSDMTVYNYARAVRAFINWCVRNNEMDSAPKLRMPPKPAPIPAPYGESEIESIVAACEDVRDELIICLLLDTGIRPAELVMVRAEHLDTRNRLLNIPVGKMRKTRDVSYSKQTGQVLRDYMRAYEFPADYVGPLFISQMTGENLTYHGFRALMRRLQQATNIDMSMYRFRDTFATTSLRNGADMMMVLKALGHADLSSIKHYIGYGTEDIQRISNEFSPVESMLKRRRRK